MVQRATLLSLYVTSPKLSVVDRHAPQRALRHHWQRGPVHQGVGVPLRAATRLTAYNQHPDTRYCPHAVVLLTAEAVGCGTAWGAAANELCGQQ